MSLHSSATHPGQYPGFETTGLWGWKGDVSRLPGNCQNTGQHVTVLSQDPLRSSINTHSLAFLAIPADCPGKRKNNHGAPTERCHIPDPINTCRLQIAGALEGTPYSPEPECGAMGLRQQEQQRAGKAQLQPSPAEARTPLL